MDVRHWERFYRGGSLVSCPVGDSVNYSGRVRSAWEKFFNTLEDGSRVLDVGCGNGPVSLIAKETAAGGGLSFVIDAVDLAQIDPLRDVPDGDRLFDGITFHPGVRADALPFPDECMDAVVGQYILEYTDIAETCSEIYRILKPGGCCQFIVHHDQSVIVRNARESLRQIGAVREHRVPRLLASLVDTPSDKPHRAKELAAALSAAMHELREQHDEADNALVLDWLGHGCAGIVELARTGRRGEATRAQKQLEAELSNWRARLEDLVRGARSAAQLRDIETSAARAGLSSTETAPQYQDDGALIGWRINMARN